MHKLLAIFLTIGVVNSALIPQDNGLVSQNKRVDQVFQQNILTVPKYNGEFLNLFGLYDGGNKEAQIPAIAAEIQQLKYKDVTTLGPALLQVAELFGAAMSQSDIRTEAYQYSVDLQLIADFLNQYQGKLSLESFLVVLLNIVNGLQAALEQSVQFGQDEVSFILKFIGIVHKNVTFSDVQATIQKLSSNGVTEFGFALSEIAPLYGLQISFGDIPSKLANIKLNLSLVIDIFRSLSGYVELQSILNVLLNTSGRVNVVFSVPGSVLNIIFDTFLTGTQVNVNVIKGALQKLIQDQPDGYNTLAQVLIAIEKLYGLQASSEQIPTALFNMKVNISKILAGLGSKIRMVAIYELFSILSICVDNLSAPFVSVPKLTNHVNIVNIQALLQKLNSGGVSSLGVVIVEIYKLFGITSLSLPINIYNIQVNIPSILAVLYGQSGTITINQFLNIISIQVNIIFNLIEYNLPAPTTHKPPTLPPPVTLNVHGSVHNAVNDNVIPNAEISLYNNQLNDATVPKYKVNSNANGQFSINNVVKKSYVLTVKAEGFITYSVQIDDVENQLKKIVLSPKLSYESARIVLTWGSSPKDLDSHLWGNTNSGSRFHVFYSAKQAADGSAILDIDHRQGSGPETTTIKVQNSGVYRYAIYNYSGAPAITTSGAKVTVYQNDNRGGVKQTQFSMPTTGSGRWWYLFEMDGETGQITKINKLSDVKPE